MIELQVLVATCREAGIQRMAAHAYPVVEGVEYIVAWQLPDGDATLPAALCRPDIRVIKSQTCGLAKNRNIALDAASAPIVLIADDDLDYTPEGLRGVIEAFRARPEAHLLTFQYASQAAHKDYPPCEVNWRKPHKNMYITSFEIAARLSAIKGKIRFDERFGIGGSHYASGEDDIFLIDALNARLSCRFIPFTICSHRGTTTSERQMYTPEFIRAKGAVMQRLYPLTWPLRLLSHLWRNRRDASPHRLSTITYARSWLYFMSCR